MWNRHQIFRIIRLIFLKFLNGLWAIPAVMIIWLVRPIFLVKLVSFRSEHIGGLVPKSATYLMHYKKQPGVFEIYGTTGKNNSFWVKLIKRSGLPIFGPWVQHLWYWINLLPNAEKNKIPNKGRYFYDETNWDFQYEKIMPFNSNEKNSGEEWLRNHGWQVGQPYVCIIVRDSAFLDHLVPPTVRSNWDYHSYRDSDINTYIEGIKWLCKQGYFVIRMGSKMRSPILYTNKNLVDYPFCNEKSDFLDVWLFANCTYTISTGTGPDLISAIYNKPILFINALPFAMELVMFFKHTIVPKKLFKTDTGTPLTIKEYFLTHNFYSTATYLDENILIEDLKSDEILDYIMEFDSYVKGDVKMDKDYESMQEYVWQIYFDLNENYKLKKHRHPKATFSQLWISKNCQNTC